MKITFNKAAYCVKLPSLEEAGNVYKNYIDVFFILKKEKRITEGIEFFGEMIDTQQWITSQGHTIYDLKKCWGKYDVDRQRMLLQMFSMMASGKSSPTPSKSLNWMILNFKYQQKSGRCLSVSKQQENMQNLF